MSLFIERYQPTNISQIVGNKKILLDVFNWIQHPTTKLCLIHGPTGIGKSLCVKLICHELNIQPYYIDNSQENVDINILKSMNRINSMTNKKNYIIIEEIDTISNIIIDEIIKDINNIHIPIICIGNTNYIPSMKVISDKIINFKMFAPYNNEILTFLYPILRENKISLKQNELNDIINNCNCDVRYILNTLEMMTYGKNNEMNIKDNTSLNMFDISKGLFDMDKSIDEKYNLFFLEYSIMPLFIQENYINNTIITKDVVKKMENISNSAQSLVNGDIFERMLHENNDWDLEKYIAICDIEATNECNTKMIKFPEYFKKNKKQFSSYENSLKNINYYYAIDSQIDKLSIEKKKINKKQSDKTNITKRKESKNINIKNKKKTNENEEQINKNKQQINEEEPIILKILPKKIVNKKKITQQFSDDEEISFSRATIRNKKTELKEEEKTELKLEEKIEIKLEEEKIEIKLEEKIELKLEEEKIELKLEEKIEEKQKQKQKNKLILKHVDKSIENKIEENTITCECGTIIKKSSKSSHLKSKKHIELLERKK